jgi:nucleoside-diphosphate-sugar epimerase
VCLRYFNVFGAKQDPASQYSAVIPKFIAIRKGDVEHSLADIEKAKKLLNYYPKVSFKEGLRKTLDFYRKPLASVNSL